MNYFVRIIAILCIVYGATTAHAQTTQTSLTTSTRGTHATIIAQVPVTPPPSQNDTMGGVQGEPIDWSVCVSTTNTFVEKDIFTSPRLTCSTFKSLPSGSGSFSFTAILLNTPVFAKLAKQSRIGIKRTDPKVNQFVGSSITFTAKPYDYILSDEQIVSVNTDSFTVSSRLNPTNHPDIENFDIQFQVSETDSFTSEDVKFISPSMKIAPDGTYSWTEPLSKLNTNETYNIRQVFRYKPNKTISYSGVKEFNAQHGSTLSPQAKEVEVNKKSYRLLAPLPGLSVFYDPDVCAEMKEKDPKTICAIDEFLNYFLQLMIGLAAVFLVLKIMYVGVKYMVTDIASVKVGAKEELYTACMGLLIALSSYLILNTINPRLVSNNIQAGKAVLEVDIVGDAQEGLISTTTKIIGEYCPKMGGSVEIKKIAESYKGKVTYCLYNSAGKACGKGQTGPNSTVQYDCSGFVDKVWSCAGLSPASSNKGTSGIFSNSEKVVMGTSFIIKGNNVFINDKILKPGDLIGWPQGSKAGHVLIYVGDGIFMDSHSSESKSPGSAIGTFSASQIKSLYGGSRPGKTITNIKRI